MPVDISHMDSRIFHEITVVIAAHQNNNLFSERILSCHLNSGFGFRIAFDDVIDLVNFFCIEDKECFLDFENF